MVKEIKEEVEKLISLKQEGSYWDFKREWYAKNKKSDLLHDIICMANNLENRNAYIIIGVDQEKDYTIENVQKDVNRINTQKMVDFLKDKKFAAGIRPIVYVDTISFGNKIIDVIVIKNSYDTPYFLTEAYQGVRANYIYSRIMDTNTPLDRSADFCHVEYLWKKRFRLLSTPIEKVEHYLEEREDWLDSPTDSMAIKYYKYFPEFTIEKTLEDEGDAYQYYLFNQTDKRPHWREISIYYHRTMLYSLEGVSLDGGRYFTAAPETDGIALGQSYDWDIVFKYFIKNSLRYKIHVFYYKSDGDEATMSHRKFVDCLLIFESEEEKELFKDFVLGIWYNKDDYSKNIHTPNFEKIEGYKMDVFEEQYKNVQILRRMLSEFRKLNAI